MPGQITCIEPTRRGGNYDKLTPRQRMFCDSILADPSFNAVKAAAAAGYKAPDQSAAKLLRQKRIQAIIGKHIHERLTNFQWTAQDVLNHLANALFLDPLELFNKVGKNSYEIRNLEDIPIEIRRCIEKIKTRTRVLPDRTRETIIEIGLMSKTALMNHALKHFGLVSPDEKNVNVDVQVTFQQALERIESQRKSNVVDADFIRRHVEE